MEKLKSASTWLEIISTVILSLGLILANKGFNMGPLTEVIVAVGAMLTAGGIIAKPKEEAESEPEATVETNS